jgi:hypothetical protein
MKGTRTLEKGELVSFLLAAAAMLLSSVFFPAYYWIFVFLAVIDGLGTATRIDFVVTIDRLVYSLLVLLLGGILFGLSVLPMILETVGMIALLDQLFLIRRIHWQSSSDFFQIIVRRLRSYLFTLVPAAVFSIGLIYISALGIGVRFAPANTILELGLGSITVFGILLYMAIRPRKV